MIKTFVSLFLWHWSMRSGGFLWVDIEANGGCDATIWNDSNLKSAIRNQTLRLPPPQPLPNDDKDRPYFIISDDAFGITKNIMIPFSQRNLTREECMFNYPTQQGWSKTLLAYWQTGDLAYRGWCNKNTELSHLLHLYVWFATTYYASLPYFQHCTCRPRRRTYKCDPGNLETRHWFNRGAAINEIKKSNYKAKDQHETLKAYHNTVEHGKIV